VTHLPAFARADGERSDIGIVVGDLEPAELAVAAAGEKGGVDKIAEGTVAAAEQARDLVGREITDDRRIDRSERLHAAPGVV